ncbi:MAG: class I SAM-dependent methyltransferase [Phycisphaerales bacterium]|nr:class I SAM-dependent methyltransferase [Phycisphaerales bacterium]
MSKRKDKKKKAKGIPSHWRTAKTSDRHELYELSVQSVDSEVDFIDKVWEHHRGRLPVTVREDFCGTFASSCTWVNHREGNTAVGVDLDTEVLEWGRNHNLEKLTEEQRARVTVIEGDVLTTKTDLVDTVLAMNFSYYLFKSRKALLEYFKVVRSNLKPDGIFICDAYGGSESFSELEEERDLDGFTYVWDQSSYNPVSGEVVNHIHFRFPDKTTIEKAFTYEWRLWTLPEIRELLEEAGFKDVTVWWEGDDEDGDGNGEFDPVEVGEACEGWIVYLTALP